MSGRRRAASGPDGVEVAMVVVPAGERPPSDWLARHPDWIMLPAKMAVQGGSPADGPDAARAALTALSGSPPPAPVRQPALSGPPPPEDEPPSAEADGSRRSP